MKNKFSMALTIALVLALIAATFALADQIANNIDAVDATFEVLSLNTGGAASTVNLYVVTENGDGKNGCNFTGSTTLQVNVNNSNAAIASVSPASITFGSCGDVKPLTVTPLTAGSTNITLSLVSNTTSGSFDLGTASFTVNVAPPANTAPNVSVTGVTAGAMYEYGAVPAAGCLVSDAEDGSPSVSPAFSVITGPLHEYGLGSQTAECSYTDNGGLTTTASATYSINDTIAPALTVPANITEEATSASGASVTFSATATDAVDPDPTVTCAPDSGDLFALGTTNVSCTATDVAGNSSAAQTFAVLVQDTTDPSIDTNDDLVLEATGPSGAVATFSNPAASDVVDTNVAVVCAPASGSTFVLGHTAVTCTATDDAGNSAQSSFDVLVQDTTDPTITFVSRLPAANGFGWNNSSVTVTWSCSDIVGVLATPVSQTISGDGAGQSATGICEDTSGNTASDTKTGINIDLTAPTLAWNGSINNGDSFYFGSVPAAPTCTAGDTLSGPNGCGVTGYDTSVGSHTLTATAYDKAGNSKVETRSYTVLGWTPKGFYQPVDMPNPAIVWNTVKNGSTVPLKFEVFAGTTELMDVSVIQSYKAYAVTCSAGSDDAIETLSATGNTVLRYDTTSGQFIFNWQTPKQANTCHKIVFTMQDGSSLTAYFKLK